jgi:apolipoprotein N-acyltransferase
VFRSNFGRLREIGRDMPGGTRSAPLRVGGVPVADAICFDVAYDDLFEAQLRHGARMITVQTSNAMFIETDQVAQQFEITRLRALASGRALAVASVNGISGVVGPDGDVLARAAVRTPDVLVEEVPLSSSLTPGVRLGPWPARALALVALLALWVALTPGRRVPYRRRAAHPGADVDEPGPDRHDAGSGGPAGELVPATPSRQRGGTP